MTTINLKDFFYWYKQDVFIEVTEEVAAELEEDKRYEPTHWRRTKRNKANYSLDAEDGIEKAAWEFEPSPEECMALMEQYRRLCCALNQLPEAQGRRIEAVYLLGMTTQEVAVADGVSERAVQIAIERGLENMKKFF